MMEESTASTQPSQPDTDVEKINSEVLLFWLKNVANVGGDGRNTLGAAGLLSEPTWGPNVRQEQETSDASYQTDLLICKL